MNKTVKPKRIKIDIHFICTLRKLRNVPLEAFREIILKEYALRFSESELNQVKRSAELIVLNLCSDYKYSESDFFLLKEANRLITTKIPLVIRKNVETFEKAHHIKTMWGDYVSKNRRGENFKFDSYE